MSEEQDVINKLVKWAKRKADIRALLLTSSRTNPQSVIDEFTDYDVIVVVKEIKQYLDDEAWLGEFGKILVLYRDPVEIRYGYERFIRVTQYEDGLKIDFTLWPVDLLKHVAGMEKLPGCNHDGTTGI